MLKDVDINEEAASLKRKPNNIEIRGCKGGDEQVKQIVTLSTSQHNKQYTQLKLQITANIEKTKPAKFQNCETTLPPIDRSKIPPSVPLDSLKGFCYIIWSSLLYGCLEPGGSTAGLTELTIDTLW